MPNHVKNIVRFNAEPEKAFEIFNFIRRDNGELGSFDFNKIIQMPEELEIEASSRGAAGYKAYKEFIKRMSEEELLLMEDITKLRDNIINKYDINKNIFELGKKYYFNVKNYGTPTWYEWSINNWGTKWNAYDCDILDEEDMVNSNHTICFQTAWSSVPDIIRKLSELFSEIEFEYSYADEDLGNNCGELNFKSGEYTHSCIPDFGKESQELAFNIWGYDIEECGYIYNNKKGYYEYRE